MSTVDDIFTILFDYSAGYRLMRRKLRGGFDWEAYHEEQKKKIKELKEMKNSTLRVTLARLKKQGLVEQKYKVWIPTHSGELYYKKRMRYQEQLRLGQELRKKQKDMIITFDVPEEIRASRDWLREKLLTLGFIPLQKSVWFGPSPLPQIFLEELLDRDLLPSIKFFRATEETII